MGRVGDRLERVGGWERVIAWAQAAQLREIAGFVAAAECDPVFGEDPGQVAASVAAEVGLMCRLSPRTADGRIDDAVALVERLPATWAALAAGRIGLPGARALAEETLFLDGEQARRAEDAVLAGAEGQTPSQIRAAARRVVARIDAEALRRRAAKARRERGVSLSPEPDGMASLAAYLPAQDAVAGGFPCCRMPAHRCDLDHRVPFDPANDQGPTSEHNLDPHCTPHHLLKHSPGWSVTRQPDGTLIWHTPTGHTYHRHPPPVGEPDPQPPPPPAAEPDDPPF